MRWIVLFLCATLVTPVMARPINGRTAIMRESDFGCKQYADWTRFIELAADNDMKAMAKLGLQKCKMIRKGTQVKIETFEYPPGSMNMSNRGADGLPKIYDVCARPRGEPECLWLTNEMLIK